MSKPKSDSVPVFFAPDTVMLIALIVFNLLAGTFLLTGCLQPQTLRTAPQVRQIDQLLASAGALEKQGHYLQAQQQCERALGFDPRHSKALDCKARLDRALRQWADRKVENGIAMAKQGKPDAADRLFLEALRLWPLHEQALRQIARHNPLTQTPFISHTLKPGGNLSTLALKYYGNSRYYPLIAEFNRINRDSKVKAGQRLRIPKINGLPLDTHGAALQTMTPGDRKVAAYRVKGLAHINAGRYKQAIATLQKALQIDNDDLAVRQYLAKAYHQLGQRLFDKKEYAEARDRFETGLKFDPHCKPCQKGLAGYNHTMAKIHTTEGRRLFKAHRYEAAVAEFDKARKLTADDQQIDDIISQAYFQEAKRLYSMDEFLAARDHFELAAKFNPNCYNCSDYSRQCRDAYLQTHYNRAINYYQNDQAHAAIAEWNKVIAIDPHYKAVRYNLDLARSLMGLDEE